MIKKFNIYIVTTIILQALFLGSCSSYSILPKDTTSANNIDGLYLNDCELTPFGEAKLWSSIKPDTKYNEEGLKVSLKTESNKRISATLYKDTIALETLVIKGKTKEKQYFAVTRKRYIVPIFPILWWYKNYYYRLFATKESVIIEDVYDTGGVAIIMAGGNTDRYSWEFKRIKKH